MPRKYTRKTQRKTRLAKLNVAGVLCGPRPDIDFDDAQWRSIGNAYGVELSAALKRRILTALSEYLWQDQTEARAPYLRDALAAIEQIKHRMDALANFIDAIADPAGKYALSVANTCFARTSASWRRSNNDQARLKRAVSLVPVLAAYSVACAEASKRLREDSERCGFKEGQAWRSMIWKLLDIAEKFNLPSTVAKPNTKLKGKVQQSRFVRFVKALHDQMPTVNWPHPSTDSALATAISSVRAERLELGANRPPIRRSE
jgi:hypothetical protein